VDLNRDQRLRFREILVGHCRPLRLLGSAEYVPRGECIVNKGAWSGTPFSTWVAGAACKELNFLEALQSHSLDTTVAATWRAFSTRSGISFADERNFEMVETRRGNRKRNRCKFALADNS
jgi:hypothetical protein